MAPPIAGPASTATPTTPLKMPRARARSSFGNAALSSAMPSGMISAEPAPWAIRAAISEKMPVESAQATDDTTNNRIPAANSRRRPNRSPRAAPVNSSTAKLRLKALTVHCRVSIGVPNSARMVARADVSTCVSSATMKDASEVIASTSLLSFSLFGSCIAVLHRCRTGRRFRHKDEPEEGKDAAENIFAGTASFGRP